MKRYLLMFGAISLMGQQIIAQEKVISGIVVSSEDGMPMTGVAIMDKQNSNGVMTDMDGKFTIQVSPKTKSLNVSYLGYISSLRRSDGSCLWYR